MSCITLCSPQKLTIWNMINPAIFSRMLLSWLLGKDAELACSSRQLSHLNCRHKIFQFYQVFFRKESWCCSTASGSGRCFTSFCKMVFWVGCCASAFSALRARASALLLYFGETLLVEELIIFVLILVQVRHSTLYASRHPLPHLERWQRQKGTCQAYEV